MTTRSRRACQVPTLPALQRRPVRSEMFRAEAPHECGTHPPESRERPHPRHVRTSPHHALDRCGMSLLHRPPGDPNVHRLTGSRDAPPALPPITKAADARGAREGHQVRGAASDPRVVRQMGPTLLASAGREYGGQGRSQIEQFIFSTSRCARAPPCRCVHQHGAPSYAVVRRAKRALAALLTGGFISASLPEPCAAPTSLAQNAPDATATTTSSRPRCSPASPRRRLHLLAVRTDPAASKHRGIS